MKRNILLRILIFSTIFWLLIFKLFGFLGVIAIGGLCAGTLVILVHNVKNVEV